MDGQLLVEHPAGLPAGLALRATSSDYRWSVTLGALPDAKDQTNTRATIPVTVAVPPDAWSDRSVRISIAAY